MRLELLLSTCLLAAGCTSDGPAVEPPSAAAPAGHELTSHAGTWRVVYRTRPEAIPLNEPFGLTVWVLDPQPGGAPRADVKLVVDAGMPQHMHGMNRVPTLSPRDDGGFDVDGLLFHMPGEWTLTFDVERGGITERAECVVELE